MMMTLMLTAMSVAREREEGTFDQLLVTPFRPSEIMVGKALPSMLVGLTQSTMILLVAQLWFHIPFAGSYFILYLGLVLFLAAAVGIGLFLSSLVGQHAAGNDLLVRAADAVHAAVGPDGADQQHAGDAAVFHADQPLRYAISITHQVYLEGAGLAQLVPEMLALVAIAAVTLPFSAWLFRHRLR